MTNVPLVSVVMLTYQRDNILPKAINSVLAQSNSDFELIILNDGSTDKTSDVVNSFNDKRIRYFENSKNMGIAYSRNEVLKKARGKYVMIMDDDDICLPTRIDKQVSFLENNPNIDVVAGQIVGLLRVPNSHDEIASNLLQRNNIGNANIMFRRNFVTKHKIQYANISYGEDWHFWLQMLFNGAKFAAIDDDVLQKDVFSEKHYSPNYSKTDDVIFELIGSFFSPNNPKDFLEASSCEKLDLLNKTKIVSTDFIKKLKTFNFCD